MVKKRVNYFTHQLLQEQDFEDEQAYHRSMRHLHNRTFHSWGVVEGLEVKKHSDHEVYVDPGMALDQEGRELVLEEKLVFDLLDFPNHSEALILIAYREEMDPADHHKEGGVSGYTRTTETVEILIREPHQARESEVILARVLFKERGRISHVEMNLSVRNLARKLNGEAEGWLRLPFKPIRLGKYSQEAAAEHDFIVDVANTYSGNSGARGSMQIPVPPGATQLTGFRIAGTAKRPIVVRLFRTGWNIGENAGEKTMLLEENIMEPSFHKEVSIDAILQESHALAVSVTAEAESDIWLIAARFR